MDIAGQLRKKFPSLREGPNGEYLANCPACFALVGKEDTKQHLYINPTKYNPTIKKKGSWFCHRCNYKGWGLENLGITLDQDLNNIKELKTLGSKLKEKLLTGTLEYPESFSTSFSDSKFGMQAYSYLTKVRKITPDKIAYYRLGYCSHGKYKDCVILPVFEQGNLVYFVARNIFYKRYLNSPIPNRDILFNYNPNAKRIILTEGIFDAIAVGYDGMALLGKFLKQGQKNLIAKAQPKEVYVLLDDDAKDWAVEIGKSLKQVVPNVFLVSTGAKHDAGEMSPDEVEEALKIASPVTLRGILDYSK